MRELPSGYTLKVRYRASLSLQDRYPNGLPDWEYEHKLYPTLDICEDAIEQKMQAGYYAEIKKIPHYSFEAMQTFAQQESKAKAVGFAEWKDKNTKESPYVVGKFEYKNGLYTTAQLYAIYLKNKF